MDHTSALSRPVPGMLAALLVAWCLVLAVAPATVVAAGPVTVTGTVAMPDGTPVVGAHVGIGVVDGDTAVAAVTGDDGSFTAEIEAYPGDVLQVSATSSTGDTWFDENGCKHTDIPAGSAERTLGDGRSVAIDIALDQVLRLAVCSETATPGPTPPATDTVGTPAPPAPDGTDIGLALLGLFGLVGVAALVRSAGIVPVPVRVRRRR